MATKTSRNLISGSGTLTTTAGSRVLTLSSAQTFKPGATIYISDGNGTEKLTIDQGSGTSWTTVQPAAAGAAGRSFSMSDTGTGKGRGSSGWLVPNAAHYAYQSIVDDAGNPDCYVYYDTLAPENGVHLYTLRQDDRFVQDWQGRGPADPGPQHSGAAARGHRAGRQGGVLDRRRQWRRRLFVTWCRAPAPSIRSLGLTSSCSRRRSSSSAAPRSSSRAVSFSRFRKARAGWGNTRWWARRYYWRF